jgi:hypothetical protein
MPLNYALTQCNLPVDECETFTSFTKDFLTANSRIITRFRVIQSIVFVYRIKKNTELIANVSHSSVHLNGQFFSVNLCIGLAIAAKSLIKRR